jgi:NAD(P)-dependent dehydrogenase (short-subunit alcohol dehydrogenase family)
MRIASPPTEHSCFYGVDTPERSKLLAAQDGRRARMRDFIHADSLAFVSIDGLYKALGEAEARQSARRRPAILRRLLHRRLSDDTKEFAKVITLNISANQALIAAFDPLLRASQDARVVALTSSVAKTPRPYWGGYAATKAALEALVLAYGEEVKNISSIRTHIVDPGATRSAMRAKAFPGEDPATLKGPEVVGRAILDLVTSDAPDGHRIRVEA